MPTDKIEKLKKLLEIANDGLSEKKFLDNFRTVIDVIKKAKEEMALTVKSLDTKYNAVVSNIEDICLKDVKNIRDEAMKFCTQEMRKLISEHRAKLTEIDNKIASIRDGKDADEVIVAEKASNLAITAILDKVVAKDDLNEEISKAGNLIADTISGLLEIEDIKDLRKELDELKKIKGSRMFGGGGGFSLMAMTQYMITETPTDSGDHLTFTINHTPVSGTLKLYRSRARQNLTEDYTISNKTIVLSVALDPTSESLICDYIRS